MTTISAKIIADSVSPAGIRLTTMELKYPRFIHAEFMTHRVFSRNAASSRAIPVEKMIQAILDDTAMPLVWTKNQPGMQGYEECNELIVLDNDDTIKWLTARGVEDTILKASREMAWNYARDNAIEMARKFHAAGYHKQIVNRLLEPFMHITVVVTATDWENFYALRNHEAAEPHIQMLARAMKEAQDNSIPRQLEENQWHLPYVTEEDWKGFANFETQTFDIRKAIETSVARCARISYVTTEGRPSTYEEDHDLYERLVGSDPMHASPAEHQAVAHSGHVYSGNFKGWRQFRKILEQEKFFHRALV